MGAKSNTSRKELIAALLEQIRRGSTRSLMLHTVVAERLGLNLSDQKCADQLRAEAGLSTPGRLAALTGLTTGAITGVLDRLERAGFVKREADVDDRRRTWVRLTPERMPNMQRIFAPLTNGMDSVCAKYTTAELQIVLRFLRDSEDMAAEAVKEVRRQGELERKRAV